MSEISQHAFSEKVALVSRGDTAIGKAVALQLALYGAYVIVALPRQSEQEAVIEELKSLGTLAASAPFDAFGESGTAEIIGKAEKQYGRLDLLVNCAPTEGSASFEETSKQDFSISGERILESYFFLTQRCVGLMRERPSPKIVNIFSAVDGEDSSAHVAAKIFNESIGAFTKALANHLPGKFQVNGIRVSDRASDDSRDENLDPDLFRAKPAVDPDDVARIVLFLLSSEARSLRGQILNITG